MSSSSNNSTCELLWPQGVACSGHGACVDSKCICDVGYTGIGDFATAEGADCDIDLLAIRVLWGLSIIPVSITGGLSLRYLWLKRRVMAMPSNQDGHLSWFDTINLVPMCASLFSVLMIILASIKVYDPTIAAIGASLPVTVLFGFMFKAFWTMQSCYAYVFLQITAGQAKMKSQAFKEKLRAQLKRLRQFLYFITIADFIWGFCPLILLRYPDIWYGIGPVHYIGASLSIAFIGLIVFPRTLAPVRDDIREVLKTRGFNSSAAVMDAEGPAHDHDDVKDARNKEMHEAEMKLTEAYNFVWNTCFQQFIIACIFGLWPFLLHKVSYQLPITWSTAHGVATYEVHSISNFISPPTPKVSKPNGSSDNNKISNGVKGSQVHVISLDTSVRVPGFPASN